MASGKVSPETDAPDLPAGRAFPESAPSLMQEDALSVARVIGLVSAVAAIFGGLIIVSTQALGPRWIPQAWGVPLFAVGILGLLYHAARDAEQQVRRMYLVVGVLWVVAAAVVSLIGGFGVNFLPWGVVCLGLAPAFLLSAGRHETDPALRDALVWGLAALGGALAATGFIGGIILSPPSESQPIDFLLKYGLLLLVLGLWYLWPASQLAPSPSQSTRLVYGFGGLGLLMFLWGGGRTLVPLILYWVGSEVLPPKPYFVPYGYLLALAGLLYLGVALGAGSDNRIVVLTRRELAAFFYSPMAYFVLIGMTAVGWFNFFYFVFSFSTDTPKEEPIVQNYILNLFPIMSLLAAVPVVTMRLLSEEKRTGTYEVLMTAPVSESAVVLSKFAAALIFFLVLWLPWGLFLVFFRLGVGQPFDFRPLLSFGIALVCSGAGFVSMGLFFSSLTRNQLVAAVLTFMGMMVPFGIFLVGRALPLFGLSAETQGNLQNVFKLVSFVDMWFETLAGRLWLRDVVFQLSQTAFFLFLTTKVLEARRWS